MVFSSKLWQSTDGVSMCSMLWTERMLRRLYITGLMVEASRKVHTTVVVLLIPEVGHIYIYIVTKTFWIGRRP